MPQQLHSDLKQIFMTSVSMLNLVLEVRDRNDNMAFVVVLSLKLNCIIREKRGCYGIIMVKVIVCF